MPAVERLKRRREFLEVAGQGRKWATPGLVLQALQRPAERRDELPDAPSALRYGLTASRKVGGAVARNRARRRLRALAEQWLPRAGQPGTDYVLIARSSTVERPFAELEQDLRTALEKIVTARPGGGMRRPRRGARQSGLRDGRP